MRIRAFIAGVIFTFIACALAFYATLRTGTIPANADASPGPIEKFVARTSLRATLQNESPREPNPVAVSDDNLLEGIKLYGANCAICHGVPSQHGTATPIAKGQYPQPPQLAMHGVEDDPEGWTFWKIKHGIRWTGMPAWGETFDDQQIWKLALFLKRMDNLPPAAEQAWQALAAPMQPVAPADQGRTVGEKSH